MKATWENVKQDYHFTPEKVIVGLNEYFECKHEKTYITVRDTLDTPVFLDADFWLDALIEWLRKEHYIFYRPGLTLDQVEAARNAAKMCCLRAHIKDEISKRGLFYPGFPWCDKDVGIPELVDTLFKAYDECKERADKNRANATKLSEVTQELRKELKGIMDYIRQEASRNGFDLPEEIDGEPLTIKRVFHDLLELLRKRDTEIRNAKQETRRAVNEQLKKDTDYIADALRDILEALGISKSNTVHLDVFGLKTKAIQRASVIKSEHDRYLEQLDKAAADYQALDKEYQEFKNSQKSDINKLIRDYCTTHGIIAPSRYFSDRVSVEYVFSLLDSYSEQRNKAYDDRDRAVDDYKLSLKDYILHDIKKRGYRYDGLETKSIEDIVDWIITMATHAYKEVEDVQKETKRKCYWYLWDALKKLSPECDALKIDCYENLVDRIFYEMSLVTENCKQCQRKHSTEKFDYIRRTNKAEEEVKELNDVIKKLKELLNEINKEEDEGWFKP